MTSRLEIPQARSEDPVALRLKGLIVKELGRQGFRIEDGILKARDLSTKESSRSLHRPSVDHKREAGRPRLRTKEAALLKRIASGSEICPAKIRPRLVIVARRSFEELLFRYASLHWSIPVSSGYGRRLRFLVIDEQNDKLIGIIGLGDPVFALKARDNWIGWSNADRELRLRYVADAFVLGAVPPYSYLLCGKLVALLAASDEIREAFCEKYGQRESLIRHAAHDGRIALITTTSALGRSSIYNRLRFKERKAFESVGFTEGSGEFHFCNGLYESIREFADNFCVPTAKKPAWGSGFRSRREVVKKALVALGLSTDWLYHGVRREIFVAPLAQNAREFLRGETEEPVWSAASCGDLYDFFRERWLFPRAAWDLRYRTFDPSEWRLWPVT